MSGKVKNKGSSNYDTHNNIMALEGDIDDQMKYKINKVMEVVKNRTQDDIMLVLQFFDYDIDTTVDAFLEDGAADVLKKWNHTNSIKPTNKNKKKKKNKKKSSSQDNATVSETVSNGGAPCAETVAPPLSNGVSSISPLEVDSSQLQESNKDSSMPTTAEAAESRVSVPLQPETEKGQPQEGETIQRVKDQETPPPDSRLVELLPPKSDSTSTTAGDSGKRTTPDSATERSSVSPSDHSRSTNRNRHRSSGSQSRTMQETSRTNPTMAPVTTSAISAPTVSQAPGKKILEKSLKDLSRQTVALQRVSHILDEELDNSFKRIKTAITEAQRLLEERNQELEREMEKVKKESRQLLNQRKELAAELRQRAERASTMGEAELNELRADIKHFVVERKYDEDLGRTHRFVWDKDKITEDIKAFGEINHVKNLYSQRRQSVSSVASSSNMTSSITEPPDSSPVNPTAELDHEIADPHQESVTPDTRPQGTMFPSRARFFFRRNFTQTESNRQQYNRGTYPPRGRGESRGGRGGNRGGRRDDGYRGSHDNSYYSKPHYPSQKTDDHGNSMSGASSSESGNPGGNMGGWPPRDQRAARRGGRHNLRFQERIQVHHSPRRNFGSNERVPTSSEAHVNGNDEPSSDLMNGFVDH